MTSTQDKAYAFIKEQIINLVAKPGHKLRAQELAERLDMSRTPIREALGRLEQEGLVVRDGGWGYVVRPITFKEILDLFKIRESLEVQAAVEASSHLSDENIAAMKSVLEKAAQFLKKLRLNEFRAANRQFHLLIAAASGNDLLHRLLLMINDRIRLVSALHLDIRRSRAAEVLAENTAILGAFRKHDPERVKEAVLEHIRNSKEEFLQVAAGITAITPKSSRFSDSKQRLSR